MQQKPAKDLMMHIMQHKYDQYADFRQASFPIIKLGNILYKFLPAAF